MKHKLMIVLLLAGLTGCTSLEKQIHQARVMAGQVGDLEYSRKGFWSDSDLVVTVAPDNTRTVEYDVRSKTPGGPSVRIKVRNIPAATKEEEE